MNPSELRAISVGGFFQDPRISNIDFRSAWTLLDRDVIIFDPAGFYRAYSPDPWNTTYHGEWCVGDDDSPRLRADLARRRSEIAQALALGKTLVVFVPSPERFYAGTGNDEWSGTGRSRQRIRGVNHHSVLEPLPFPLETEAGATSELELRAGEPFAASGEGTASACSQQQLSKVAAAIGS